MNASRRVFLDTAQLRPKAKVPAGGPKQVYAFYILEGTTCTVRGRVNTHYAVRQGLQGMAWPELEFDLCYIRKQLHQLQKLPSLFWNGTAPNLDRWAAAIKSHDDAKHFVATMAKAHATYAERARQAGVATPKVQREFKRHESCAVVGGAPSLMEAELGAEIDSHEAVLRFNDHPAGAKFAKNVGSKTHYLLLNALHAGANMPGGPPERRLLQIVKNERVFAYALKSAPRRYMIEPEVFRTFYEHFGSGGLSGNIGVWFALAACKRVTLYGFSSPCELGTKYRHYYALGGPWAKYQERVQVNTVKVVLWMHALRCASFLQWAPPNDGDGNHWCSVPAPGVDVEPPLPTRTAGAHPADGPAADAQPRAASSPG
jgi:hypothetical protein